MSERLQYPAVRLLRPLPGKREWALYWWPVPGIMYGLCWGGGPYTTARTPRVWALGLWLCMVLRVDVRVGS